MKHPEPKPPRRMEVTTMFEPTRLGNVCLHDAYEHVVPVVRRPLGAQPGSRQNQNNSLLPQPQRRSA
jgi:hypothetical protein